MGKNSFHPWPDSISNIPNDYRDFIKIWRDNWSDYFFDSTFSPDNFSIVGGAIGDLINNKIPADYDLMVTIDTECDKETICRDMFGFVEYLIDCGYVQFIAEGSSSFDNIFDYKYQHKNKQQFCSIKLQYKSVTINFLIVPYDGPVHDLVSDFPLHLQQIISDIDFNCVEVTGNFLDGIKSDCILGNYSEISFDKVKRYANKWGKRIHTSSFFYAKPVTFHASFFGLDLD